MTTRSIHGFTVYAALTMLLLVLPNGDFTTEARLRLVLLLAGGALVLSLRVETEPWFGPIAFPTTYFIGLTALPPVVALQYSTDFGRLRSQWITDNVLFSAQLAIVGWMAGIILGRVLFKSSKPATVTSKEAIIYKGLAWLPAHAASAIWAFVAVGQFALRVVDGRAHGEAQTTYDSIRALDIISTGPITTGAAVYAVHLAMARDKFRRQPLVIFAVAAAIILVSGERGALLAPLILIAMSYHVYVQPLRPVFVLSGGIGLTSLFAFIQASRSGFESDLSIGRGAEAMVVDWSSPTRFMIEMTNRAEGNALEFERGATYAASIARQLPGVIANPLLGDSFRTSDAVYRELISLDNPDQGVGFAFVPEGYLNFGNPGVLLASLALALFLSAIYVRSNSASMVRPMHYLYFIVIAALPTGLRQNTLTFLKTGLYATILLSIFLIILRKQIKRVAALDDNDQQRRFVAHDSIRT